MEGRNDIKVCSFSSHATKRFLSTLYIQAGDTFVVVDCGGGTVDLISYEVVSIAPIVFKECVKGQGTETQAP